MIEADLVKIRTALEKDTLVESIEAVEKTLKGLGYSKYIPDESDGLKVLVGGEFVEASEELKGLERSIEESLAGQIAPPMKKTGLITDSEIPSCRSAQGAVLKKLIEGHIANWLGAIVAACGVKKLPEDYNAICKERTEMFFKMLEVKGFSLFPGPQVKNTEEYRLTEEAVPSHIKDFGGNDSIFLAGCDAQFNELLPAIEEARKEMKVEALGDMVWQFAYRGTRNGQLILWCGGLSALEGAFGALGWDNPHFINDETMECDVEDCHEWRSPQIHWDGMYVLICDKHHKDYCNQKPRPPMKQTAIDREASRDKNGILPSFGSQEGR